MSKSSILIVTEVFFPEDFNINDVALSWKNKGYDVDVLTLAPTYPLGRVFSGYKNSFFRKDEYQGINIFRLRAVTGYRNSRVKKILKYINFMVFGSIATIFIGRRYDYVFGFNLGSLTDMLPAVIIRKFYKKPTMFWVQDVWPDSVYAYGFKKTKILSIFLDFFVKFMYHNINNIAISSKGFESKLEPYIKKGLKFCYAPNWANDLNMDMNPIALSATQKVHFTFAGNVGKVQNLENIVNAFQLLPKNYKEKTQLNIIGDGSNLENIRLLSGNCSNIVFYGKKSREEMASFYKSSNFLIVSLVDKPIFSSTVPCKLQTYIAAKKPILAVINGETADIVSDNNLGISVDPSNVGLIKGVFEKCIDMPENEKSEFVINNAKLLETTFNKDSIINKMTSQLTGCND
jgi:glycosyltransferase involved in cell wall biosynthesis